MAETINTRRINLRRPLISSGMWLISLLVWYPIWTIVEFSVFEGSSKPISEVTLMVLSFYPIIAIMGASFNFAKYYLSNKWALFVSLVSLVAVAGIIFVVVSITTAAKSYNETQRINEFWNNPPPRINEFEDTNLKAVVPLEPYAEFFILPDSVESSDVILWNGTTLIFETDQSPQRVSDFYDESFNILGFRLSGSHPRLKQDTVEFDTTNVYAQEEKNQQGDSLTFTVVVNKIKMDSTHVRLEPCKSNLFSCLETRIDD